MVMGKFLQVIHVLSTLAAARADNFYYPRNWSQKRFEMSYNIWCGGCNSMIAKGVRFNAENKQVGNYYSTKVHTVSLIDVYNKLGEKGDFEIEFFSADEDEESFNGYFSKMFWLVVSFSDTKTQEALPKPKRL
ncbi:nuclear protein-like protein [Tanacetum coccineum]